MKEDVLLKGQFILALLREAARFIKGVRHVFSTGAGCCCEQEGEKDRAIPARIGWSISHERSLRSLMVPRNHSFMTLLSLLQRMVCFVGFAPGGEAAV